MTGSEFERAVGRPIRSRAEFIAAFATAIEDRQGWAGGKLGGTERTVLDYPRVLETERDVVRRRAFEQVVAYKACRLAGVFPADTRFLESWTRDFSAAVRSLDSVGFFATALPHTARLITYHGIAGELVDQRDQQFDRSTPADASRCWLPLLRGKRLLLVCPFASLLQQRATRETFEAVWAKTGRTWFDPASVGAVDFAYGIDESTQQRYGSCGELMETIVADIERNEFDVALIAAGALGIPLAVRVKALGRVGLSLGGVLQVLFGVHGERWLAMEKWRERFINDAWIRVPERYAPRPEAIARMRATLENETYW